MSGSSFEAVVKPLGAVVVSTGCNDGAEEEPEEGGRVAIPGDEWVNEFGVAVADVVHEDVDEAVEDLELPVDLHDGDVTEPDVDGGHGPWGQVENDVSHEHVGANV